jgi:hypothetical protein
MPVKITIVDSDRTRWVAQVVEPLPEAIVFESRVYLRDLGETLSYHRVSSQRIFSRKKEGT